MRFSQGVASANLSVMSTTTEIQGRSWLELPHVSQVSSDRLNCSKKQKTILRSTGPKLGNAGPRQKSSVGAT